MKRNRKLYVLINTVMFSSMLIYLAFHISQLSSINLQMGYFILAILAFLLIHTLRIIRQYLILMEDGMEINRLCQMYFTSSLANTIFPYRIGELYKMYLYGFAMKNYKKSFLGVLIDKYFDALFLLVIFTIAEVTNGASLSMATILLLVFVSLIAIVYLAFDSTYYYLNKYIILNKNSKVAVKCLRLLEKANELYKASKGMVKNRATLLMLLTIFSWMFEVIFVFAISKLAHIELEIMNFINYINHSFLGIPDELLNYYISFTAVIVVIFIIGRIIQKAIGEGKNEKKSNICL